MTLRFELRRVPLIAVCAALGLVCGASAQRPVPPNAELAESVTEYADRMGAIGFSGVILLERAGEVLYARGHGWADREGGLPYTTGTVFSLGSITKPFTATAILTLAERGLLSLEDTLGAFMPDLPADRSGITIEQLLTHHANLSEAREGDFDPVDDARLVEIVRTQEPNAPPGTQYIYSNLGFSILGYIIEQVTGREYEVFLRDELLVPMGLYETGYTLAGWDEARLARGYNRDRTFGTVIERFEEGRGPYWVLKANGGLHSTVFDVLRWVRGTLRGEAVSAWVAETLTTPRASAVGGDSVAASWRIRRSPGGTPVVEHGGSNGIFYASVRYYPEEDATLIVSSNRSELDGLQVATSIERIMFGEAPTLPPRIEPVAMEPAAREAMTGAWRIPGAGGLQVGPAGNDLIVRVSGQALLNRILDVGADGVSALTDMNREAEAVARAVTAGERQTLEALTSSRIADILMEIRDSRSLRGVEVLGTVPIWFASPYATWITLQFQDGSSSVRRLHWGDDGSFYGLGGSAYPSPLELVCPGTGARECTAAHPVVPVRATRLRLEAGQLMVSTDGDVHAAEREDASAGM